MKTIELKELNLKRKVWKNKTERDLFGIIKTGFELFFERVKIKNRNLKNNLKKIQKSRYEFKRSKA